MVCSAQVSRIPFQSHCSRLLNQCQISSGKLKSFQIMLCQVESDQFNSKYLLGLVKGRYNTIFVHPKGNRCRRFPFSLLALGNCCCLKWRGQGIAHCTALADQMRFLEDVFYNSCPLHRLSLISPVSSLFLLPIFYTIICETPNSYNPVFL